MYTSIGTAAKSSSLNSQYPCAINLLYAFSIVLTFCKIFQVTCQRNVKVDLERPGEVKDKMSIYDLKDKASTKSTLIFQLGRKIILGLLGRLFVS